MIMNPLRPSLSRKDAQRRRTVNTCITCIDLVRSIDDDPLNSGQHSMAFGRGVEQVWSDRKCL